MGGVVVRQQQLIPHWRWWHNGELGGGICGGDPPQRLQFLGGAGPLWLWPGKGRWTSLTLASSHILLALSPENVVACPDWMLTKVS